MAADMPPEMPHGLEAVVHAIFANIDDAKALLLATIASVLAWAWRVEKRLREMGGLSKRVDSLDDKTKATDNKLDQMVVMIARIDERTELMMDRGQHQRHQ